MAHGLLANNRWKLGEILNGDNSQQYRARGSSLGKNNGRSLTIAKIKVGDQRGQQNSRGWTVNNPKKFRPFSLPVVPVECKSQTADEIEIFLGKWRLSPALGRVRWNRDYIASPDAPTLQNPFPDL